MIKVPNLNNSKLKYGNFPLFGGVGSLSIYKANRLRPELLSDFTDGSYYSANSSSSTTFSDLITHARASNGTYHDADGNIQTAGTNEPRVGHHLWDGSEWVNAGLLHESESRTNLLLNSASLETQTVAVTPDTPHTLSFYPGAATVDLDESIASTAVDVFIYDTSKDSDGGAWRKRCTRTSWFNEPLNTATRGSRREFPAVAVIVAEATKITIYDGDDPALPMWMVFSASFGNIMGAVGGGQAVSALNGWLAIGSALYDVKVVDLIADRGARAGTFTIFGPYLGTIATRNDNSNWGNGASFLTTGPIIGRNVNDVAMTVLPDAPIDPATGLPVPTIAVATDGGVSVIKDDGTVVDFLSASFGGGYETYKVDFDVEGNLYAQHSVDGRGHVATLNVYYHDIYPIAPDRAGANANGDVSFGFSGGAVDFPSLLRKPRSDINQYFRYVKATGNLEAVVASENPDGAAGIFAGLSHLKIDRAAPSNSMVAYTTSTYNTGWMNGDIKGAFLSDTDDTDLVGSGELVTNGTFDSDTSGWAGLNATLSYQSGVARATANAAGFSATTQTITGLSAGDVLYITGEITAQSGATYAFRIYAGGSTGAFLSNLGAGVGVHSGYITVPSGYTSITLAPSGTATSSSDYVEIDNISVKLADADRSVNNNGLIVNGTVSRDPVSSGADLVAYSGFSSSNYLEQPYNPDLDFGTGDFCVMGWVKPTATNVQNILSITDKAGTAFGSNGYITLRYSSGWGWACSGGSVSSAFVATLGWQHVCLSRESGVLSLYVDGVLAGTAANSGSLGATNDASVLLFGLGFYNSGPSGGFGGELALWRISATAPTADQILKIYNDEKVLFQENAQATLYGSSDAVTALAHDPDTDLLHVGTSAGRSVFNGLRRINNTTTGVTTAISANNGVIAEQ